MQHIVNGGQAYDTNTWLPPSTPTAKLTEMQLSLWAIRDMVTRIGRDIELLLEERTKPAQVDAVQIQAKKLPTAPPVQIDLGDEESEDDVMQTERRRRAAIERFERRVAKKLGGAEIFKKKLRAKIARIRIEGSTATSGKGYGIGKLRIEDEMIFDKDGECKPESCTVDFFTVKEREQLKEYIRENYSYIIKGRHA